MCNDLFLCIVNIPNIFPPFAQGSTKGHKESQVAYEATVATSIHISW